MWHDENDQINIIGWSKWRAKCW